MGDAAQLQSGLPFARTVASFFSAPGNGLRALAIAAWVLAVPVAPPAVLILDQTLRGYERARPAWVSADDIPLITAIVSCATMGLILALHRPQHRVGWLFLGLGVLIMAGGLAESVLAYLLLAKESDSELVKVIAALEAPLFVFWIMTLTLILLLTPSGHLPSARWRPVAALALLCTPLAYVFVALRSGDLQEPLTDVPNVLAIGGPASDVVSVLASAGIWLTTLLLAASAVSLIFRFRGGSDIERRQLKWVLLGAFAIPPLILAQVVIAVVTPDSTLQGAVAGVFITAIPITTGLAVLQYRLYDIDRIISRAVAWLILTAGLVAFYAAIAVVLGLALSSVANGSSFAIAAATAATALVFNSARTMLQDVVDRRFNRRRWDATRMVDEFVRQGATGNARTIESVLAEAVAAPGLRVMYFLPEKQVWADASGRSDGSMPPPGSFMVERGGQVAAAVVNLPVDCDKGVVYAAVGAAAPELENARLRAEIRVQLVEVQESRRRVISAGDTERRRIERNLHDGAQQRLLALALELRHALDRDNEDWAEVLNEAIDDLKLAVQELRDLASGLHPAILVEDGLAPAIEALADRLAIRVRVAVPEKRLPAEIEAALYYVACEAIANAVKHAQASEIDVRSETADGAVTLEVHDDGRGGASIDGGLGLRGLADRVDAMGGRLTVDSPDGGGTMVRAAIPCAS